MQKVQIVQDLVCTFAGMSKNWVTEGETALSSGSSKTTLITQEIEKGIFTRRGYESTHERIFCQDMCHVLSVV